jgi:hypothetical protein
MGLDKRERAIHKAVKESKKRENRRRDRYEFRGSLSHGDLDDVQTRVKFTKRRTIMERH